MSAIPEKEVLRYLGNAKPDQSLLELVRSVSNELQSVIRPAGVSRRVPIAVSEKETEVGGFRFESANLAKNLAGCNEAFFAAATLGANADRLLRKYAALDLPRASTWQAACAAMLEQYLDDMEGGLLPADCGLSLRPRFSPGYGDLDISNQRAMFRILDLERRLGLSLTEGFMMLPEKSVTAIIGIGEKRRAPASGCAACPKTDCASRRDGDAESHR